MFFPVSGVETPIWLPPVVAFAISYFTSMAGISGAFLILPFQMSFLGFTAPSVSPTNLVYNVVAIPSGVYRYLREGRMVWPLTWMVVAGTLPGIIGGGFIRLNFFLDPKPFKAFVGCVLLYIGLRMFWDLRKSRRAQKPQAAAKLAEADWRVRVEEFSWRKLRFRFQGQDFSISSAGLFGLSLAVGLVGGIYGIGGGAIIAPFLVAIYRLPVHAVAGAALMGTCLTSIVGVVFFQLIAPFYAGVGAPVAPDWLLGALFGLGGLAGMYLGARTQRLVPGVYLKIMLGAILLFVSLRYLIDYLLG